MKPKEKNKTISEEGLSSRSPVVVVMGHIDHGKSRILDYIRKENIVEKEVGGITQHIGAYEAEVKCGKSHDHKTTTITFLDTPGHEAFSQMRIRGAKVADVAVLVVSTDDGPKPQTMEAYEAIKKAGVSFVVALNKIDIEGTDPERVKNQLAERQIFVENYGGNIPTVSVSAKTGEGIDELLDIILLLAEMEELTGDSSKNASGIIIESHLNPKRGITSTLLIQNGTMKKGMFVSSGVATAPVRIFEDFRGKALDEATFSSPVVLAGFSSVPEVGATFSCFETRALAEKVAKEFSLDTGQVTEDKDKDKDKAEAEDEDKSEDKIIIPILLKSDVSGSLEALEKEIKKLEDEDVMINILSTGVGKISENDVKIISGADRPVIFGFNVGVEDSVKPLAERFEVEIITSDIIYKISEWLEKEIDKRKKENPKDQILGVVEILKTFSATKSKKVAGGKVLSGKITEGKRVVIKREEEEIGQGKIIGLKKGKGEVKEVGEGEELGLMIKTETKVEKGDTVEIIKKAS